MRSSDSVSYISNNSRLYNKHIFFLRASYRHTSYVFYLYQLYKHSTMITWQVYLIISCVLLTYLLYILLFVTVIHKHYTLYNKHGSLCSCVLLIYVIQYWMVNANIITNKSFKNMLLLSITSRIVIRYNAYTWPIEGKI